MALIEDSSGMMIDEAYEFSAPRFFDFIDGESEEDVRKAELWFQTALSYAPSPCMPKIKAGRSVNIEGLCDFSKADDQFQKSSESSGSTANNSPSKTKPQTEPTKTDIVEQGKSTGKTKIEDSANVVSAEEDKKDVCTQENGSVLTGRVSSTVKIDVANDTKSTSSVKEGLEACTPKLPAVSQKRNPLPTDSKKQEAARRIASSVKNPSALKPKKQLSQVKGIKPAIVNRDNNAKNTAGTPNLAQENQAIKRQKLEGGRSRQILNVKPQNFPHKSRMGRMGSSSSSLCPSTAKTRKEDRKVYVREPAVPFISMAEMMKKFQSSTRDVSLPRMNNSLSHDDAASIMQSKPKLTLTRPKEPELETAQRVRSTRVKSSAELEEEMMAKIPKFKARPLNKKILEAPTLPSLPRTTPQLPEFQEFHLETTARANQNAETSTVASTEASRQNQWKPHLTEPKTPLLQTSLRARPPRVKSTSELEQEELEKVPKFKARPLNKRIFESRGDLGMFSNTKQHVTIPQEFHFATDERIPQPITVADIFDKLSLNSESRHSIQIPRTTMPNPFHLHTDERGAEKEKKFVMDVMQKQLEEERARIPKATPYPYTTDYPVVPPKPEPKQCTKPEPFQLESLVRHEEEMQREMEERQRMEREKAQMRMFRAQPILKEDPIPVPDLVRKPLTQVQEFNLHVDHRAVDRAEFDKKIKEKELMYKRYREETESAKMIEEEKALKQLRRTMVPHARPVPNFGHPFLPQKSTKETTKAKSPNLRVKRRERRKAMGTFTAASSAAAQMR
ncbi:protein TPX2 isoform X2 [Malania oleifera]|uniref:protein TPX2 isoform X2 n=1 Tax=Malania oleifera TaxID=397392 RepID=UPI0025AE59B2|nr:protein TPX2 isoform X2 [Malania oleifera]